MKTLTPTQTLNVTLKNGRLNVDQDGKANQIPHGEDVTIKWQLTGNAASGKFNSMDDHHPGFRWIQQPPHHVFGNASPEGNKMTMSDKNTNPDGLNSAGEWIYQIYAKIDGNEHHTTVSSKGPSLTTSDPTIQNLSPT